MGRKAIAELIRELAGTFDAEATKQESREAFVPTFAERRHAQGAKDALRSASGRLRKLAERVASAPVGADPDGLILGLAHELSQHTPKTQPRMNDGAEECRIKIARTDERMYAARRIGEILRSYEEG